MWTKKYAPEKVSDIVGQDKAVSVLKIYVEKYRLQKRKGAILYGPTGSGKTSAACAVAKELNIELVEINASDYRTPDQIEATIGRSLRQGSLFFSGKLILVDEIDGLSGMKDRGGISAITRLLEGSRYPIIMTANDPYDKKLSTLRKRCEMIQFRTLNYLSVFKRMREICEREGVIFDETALKGLARRSGGDMRAAINDLELNSTKGRFTKKELDLLTERDVKESITNALIKVLKSKDNRIALGAFDNVDEDIDRVMLWLDENIPKEYLSPEDLNRAYDALSRADVYRGRIRRWQHWRFLVYAYALITAGIAQAKEKKYRGFSKYSPPGRLLAIWRANMKYKKRRSIAEKIGAATHTSSRRAMSDILPYLTGVSAEEGIAEELSLAKDETDWLRKTFAARE